MLIINNSRIVCGFLPLPEDDDVMASIDQKADEKDIYHFLPSLSTLGGVVSKQYTANDNGN